MYYCFSYCGSPRTKTRNLLRSFQVSTPVKNIVTVALRHYTDHPTEIPAVKIRHTHTHARTHANTRTCTQRVNTRMSVLSVLTHKYNDTLSHTFFLLNLSFYRCLSLSHTHTRTHVHTHTHAHNVPALNA